MIFIAVLIQEVLQRRGRRSGVSSVLERMILLISYLV